MKEQIALSKATISYSKNKNEAFNYNHFVINVIKNCVENYKDFFDLTIIDYVLFLTKIRILSVGSIIELLTESENQDVKNVKITLDLNIFLKNLYEGSLKALENNIIKEDRFEIKISWPPMTSMLFFVKDKEEKDYEMFLNSYQEFIEYIKIGNKMITFKNFTPKQKVEVLGKVPTSINQKIQEKIINALNFLKEYNLWNIPILKNYTFYFYGLGFVDFIRLFFTYDLKSLYKEIYYFANANLPPEYILKISQAERKIYSAIIEEHQRTTQNKETKYDFETINKNRSVEDLALEFDDTPP